MILADVVFVLYSSNCPFCDRFSAGVDSFFLFFFSSFFFFSKSVFCVFLWVCCFSP